MQTLLPRSSDAAWTELGREDFNREQIGYSAEEIAGAQASSSGAPGASAAVTVGNFPSGPTWVGGLPWLNPIDAQSVDLVNPKGMILSLNPSRTGLMIQVYSSSPQSMWYAFGRAAKVQSGTELKPGAAVLLDLCCPRTALYMFSAAGAIGEITEFSSVPLPANTQGPASPFSSLPNQAWGMMNVGSGSGEFNAFGGQEPVEAE